MRRFLYLLLIVASTPSLVFAMTFAQCGPWLRHFAPDGSIRVVLQMDSSVPPERVAELTLRFEAAARRVLQNHPGVLLRSPYPVRFDANVLQHSNSGSEVNLKVAGLSDNELEIVFVHEMGHDLFRALVAAELDRRFESGNAMQITTLSEELQRRLPSLWKQDGTQLRENRDRDADDREAANALKKAIQGRNFPPHNRVMNALQISWNPAYKRENVVLAYEELLADVLGVEAVGDHAPLDAALFEKAPSRSFSGKVPVEGWTNTDEHHLFDPIRQYLAPHLAAKHNDPPVSPILVQAIADVILAPPIGKNGKPPTVEEENIALRDALLKRLSLRR